VNLTARLTSPPPEGTYQLPDIATEVRVRVRVMVRVRNLLMTRYNPINYQM
jgi:hypothetical protein